MSEQGYPVAVITGASRGIGAATALLLASRGWHVELLYRRDAEGADTTLASIEHAGGSGEAVQCDVSDPAAVEAYARRRERCDAPVEVLVNNAAITRDALLLTTSDDAWHEVLATNLTGPFLLTRALLPLMLDRRHGAVVNVSSNSAELPAPGQAAYAASKGGLEAFTRACAAELRGHGVRVNAVRPGRVRTAMSEEAADSLVMDGSRWGEPGEVAEVVTFLASEAASYVNGQIFTVDGGISAARLTSKQRGCP